MSFPTESMISGGCPVNFLVLNHLRTPDGQVKVVSGTVNTMHRYSKRLLVAVLCASGVVCWFGCAQRSATEQQPATVQVVVTTPIKKSIVEWDEYVGRFDAVDFVEVRA